MAEPLAKLRRPASRGRCRARPRGLAVVFRSMTTPDWRFWTRRSLTWVCIGMGRMVVACLRLRDEPHHLLHGHHPNAEHQMAEHLGRPAHPHVVAAAVVLQVAVDALG